MRIRAHHRVYICTLTSLLTTLGCILVVSVGRANCLDKLSSVFVLETSDSDSAEPTQLPEAAAIVSKPESNVDPNTHIITDSNYPDSQIQSTQTYNDTIIRNYSESSSPYQSSTQPSIATSTSTSTTSSHEQRESNVRKSANDNFVASASNQHVTDRQVTNLSQESNIDKQSAERSLNSRKIKEETQIVPSPNLRSSSTQVQQQAHHIVNQQHQTNVQNYRTTTSTTVRPYVSSSNYNNNNNNNNHNEQTIPKTEERLLISISSDDDDNRKPPRQLVGSSSSAYINNNEQPVAPSNSFNNPQQNVHTHKKPSITISIQEANPKQNGQGSAIIVRPGEDGQSIVIATVGSSAAHPKPAQTSNYNNGPGSSVHQPQPHHPPPPPPQVSSNQQPYREPANYPYSSSTTLRPIVNEYQPAQISPSSNNRPIVGEQQQKPAGQRPVLPVSSGDERPQRPQVPEDIAANSGYEGGSSSLLSSTSRPVNNNNNNNNNFEPGEESKGSKYPLNERNCGLIHETRIVGGEEANPDDFLWMAAIIKSKPKEGDERPFCGGSLITRRHILTAAHCLEGLTPRDVLVRLGSYDFDEFTASTLSSDFAIDQFRTPAHYNKKTHVADIAIMRLKTPIASTDNYKTVCMPQARRSYVGALGTVTGYGSQSQTFRRAAPTLRQVTVPIWENRKCSTVYKRNLTDSFLCAGYEEGGKDACQGDSGGPLMTEGPNERMMVVGVVSHGIGCGSPGYPGVYTRTSTFLDWIEKNTRE